MKGSAQIPFRSFSLARIAALAATVLASVGAPSLAQGEANMIQFELMSVGSRPAGFSFARTGQGSDGEWTIVADPTAKAGLAIEQTSADTTDYRFPLAIRDGLSAKNMKTEIRFKAVGGKVDRAAGIAVRIKDADNYYVVRANALEDNVRFYRVVAGKRQQLGTANIRVTSGEWHTLALDALDQHFAVAYDGAKLFEVTDPTFAGPGAVALWTKADSLTRFDWMSVRPLP